MKTRGRFQHWPVAVAIAFGIAAPGCVDEAPLVSSDTITEPATGAAPAPSDKTEDGTMPASISPELAAAFERNEQQSDYTQRVIITLSEASSSVDIGTIQGVSIVNRMQSVPIIVAEIDAEGLRALAENPSIKRVEPDGEMRALPE